MKFVPVHLYTSLHILTHPYIPFTHLYTPLHTLYTSLHTLPPRLVVNTIRSFVTGPFLISEHLSQAINQNSNYILKNQNRFLSTSQMPLANKVKMENSSKLYISATKRRTKVGKICSCRETRMKGTLRRNI